MNDDQRDQMIVEVHTDIKWIKDSVLTTKKDVETLKTAHNKAVGGIAVASVVVSAGTTWLLNKLGLHQ